MRVQALIVGLALTVSSCSSLTNLSRSVPEVISLQRELTSKLPGTVVGVTLVNGSSLNVNLINSPLKALPGAEKTAKASEIAKLAYDNYADRLHLKTVRVTFVVLSTFLVIVNVNDSSDAFTFDAADLGSQGH